MTRRSHRVICAAPPTFALVRSIHKMQASSGVAYFATVSKAQISPSLNAVAPRYQPKDLPAARVNRFARVAIDTLRRR